MSDTSLALSPKDSLVYKRFGRTVYWQLRCAPGRAADAILPNFRRRIKHLHGTPVYGKLVSEATRLLHREDPVRAKNFFPRAHLQNLVQEDIPRMMARSDLQELSPWMQEELRTALLRIARANAPRATRRYKRSLNQMGAKSRQQQSLRGRQLSRGRAAVAPAH